MSTSDKLFHLIQSLDSREKRYFKQYASRRTENNNKDHIMLFDLLSKAKVYHEEKIKTKFPHVGYTQFSQLKNYTYNHILAAMRSLQAEKSEYRKLLNNLSDIDFLYNKGLLDDSSELVNKSIKKASVINDDLFLLMLNNWNKKIHIRVMKGMETHDRITAIDQHCFSQLATTNWYQTTVNFLQTYVSTQYSHGTKYKNTPMPDIMSSEQMKQLPDSLMNKVWYYTIHAFDFDFLGNDKKATISIKKVLDIFESNELFKKENYELYLNSLTNYLRNLSHGEPTRFFKLLKKQRLACETGKKSISAPAYADAIFISHFFEQQYYLNQFNYKKVLEGLPYRIELYEQIKKDLRIQYRLLALANTAIIYFNTGNYKACISWSNKLMDDEELKKQRPEVYSSAKILFLLSHYELGNYEFLVSASRSTVRYLKKHQLLRKFENTVIKMLDELTKSKQSPVNVFRNFREKFKTIESDPIVRVAAEATGILYWVEAKIQKRPIIEIAQKVSKQ